MNQPRPWYWRKTEKYVFLMDAEGTIIFAAVLSETAEQVAIRASTLANRFPGVHVDVIVDALFDDIIRR